MTGLKNIVFSLFILIFINVSFAQLFSQEDYVVHNAIQKSLENKELTSECQKHLWIATKNITQLWALKMFDASSKLPSGIMSGHLADLGAFDQCMAIEHNIENKLIKGNYCKVTIPLSKIYDFITNHKYNELQSRGIINLASGKPSLWLAICVPSSCSAKELNNIISGVNYLDINIQNCQSNADVEEFNAGDYAAIVFFSLILILMVLSTAYDIYIQHIEEKPAHIILIAFSVYTNGKKLLTITKTPNQLPCLHGLRFISMMWVVVGHTYYTAFFSPTINGLDALPWMTKWTSMYILGATVSVDTFFVLGGLLMAYVYLLAKDKGIKFNVILYYIHRYIRLTPALAVAILFHVTLLRFIGSGPFWPEVMRNLSGSCSKYWWSSLLYVQNYVNPMETCISQTWYLSVDMQLFILTPLALVPLGMWPGITIIVLGMFIILSIISPFVVAYIYEMPALMSESIKNPDFTDQYYMNTYTRFGPVLIGIVLGYYVYTRNQNIKFNSLFKNRIFKYCGWIIAIGSLFAIVFAPNNMYYHDYDKWESSFYLAIHRVAWSMALSWIIYACIIGHGGIINAFLSLSVFQILSRLTYSMYLIHLSFQTMKIGLLRVPIQFGNFQNMYNFWGDFFFSAFLALIWTLAFESPMITVEKILFKAAGKRKSEDKTLKTVKTEK